MKNAQFTKWVIRVAVALVFISSGLEKFSIGPGEPWIRMFAKIGYGNWFRYFTGGLEIAGGTLLLVPVTSMVGAVLLILCMLGAIGFHLFVLGDPFSSIINALLILAIVAAGRKSDPHTEDLTTLELRGPPQ
jgi:putative oxidoreductase